MIVISILTLALYKRSNHSILKITYLNSKKAVKISSYISKRNKKRLKMRSLLNFLNSNYTKKSNIFCINSSI